MINSQDEENAPLQIHNHRPSAPESSIDFEGDTEPDTYDQLARFTLRERRRSDQIERRYRNAKLPNYSLPKRISVVAPQFIDEATLTSTQKKALRESILAPEEIRLMSDDEAAKLLTFAKKLELLCLFSLSVTMNAVDPLLDQWAVQTENYIEQSPFLMSYALAGTTAAIVACFVGKETAKAAWYPGAIFKQLPIGIAFVFGDWASTYCAEVMSPSLIKVISQTKLLVTGLTAYLLLGTRQSLTQWLLIAASTVLIISYGLLSGGELEGDVTGIIVAISNVVISCLSGVLSEIALKRVKYRYMAQMVHNRWACLIVCMSQLSVTLTVTKRWHLFPFGGWGAAQISVVSHVAVMMMMMMLLDRMLIVSFIPHDAMPCFLL